MPVASGCSRPRTHRGVTRRVETVLVFLDAVNQEISTQSSRIHPASPRMESAVPLEMIACRTISMLCDLVRIASKFPELPGVLGQVRSAGMAWRPLLYGSMARICRSACRMRPHTAAAANTCRHVAEEHRNLLGPILAGDAADVRLPSAWPPNPPHAQNPRRQPPWRCWPGPAASPAATRRQTSRCCSSERYARPVSTIRRASSASRTACSKSGAGMFVPAILLRAAFHRPGCSCC